MRYGFYNDKSSKLRVNNAIYIGVVFVAFLFAIWMFNRERFITATQALEEMAASLAEGENIFYAVDAFCEEIVDGLE